jgi:hypothetical protein
VLVFEATLADFARTGNALPGWLCGRLAVLYRSLGRHDDEVTLLERYRESQTSDDARTRYDARLSKARTLADRRRRSDSGALASIRQSIRSPRTRAAREPVSAVAPDLPAASVLPLVDLFGHPSDAEFHARLEPTIAGYCVELREREIPLHVMVAGLRQASRDVGSATTTEGRAHLRYRAALVRLLALHFSDDRA